jgi:Cu-Zn family superoxide dismutase
MTLRHLLWIAPLLLAGCVPMAPPDRVVGTANIVRSDGANIGTILIFSEPTGVLLRISATGLPPGMHGVHVHAAARCDPPKFESAGPHWNPAMRQHGHLNPAGFHAGDLGNLGVGADGKLVAGLLIPGARLNGNDFGTGPVLHDYDGASLVFHAKPDDERTDPSGNSGGRIACAVL